jgi:hypothetical protein
MLALFGSFFLKRGCRTQGGVESQVIRFPVSRACLDIAPAFTLGVCAAAPPAKAAGYPVERVLDFTRQECGADLDFFPAIPPVG